MQSTLSKHNLPLRTLACLGDRGRANNGVRNRPYSPKGRVGFGTAKPVAYVHQTRNSMMKEGHAGHLWIAFGN